MDEFTVRLVIIYIFSSVGKIIGEKYNFSVYEYRIGKRRQRRVNIA